MSATHIIDNSEYRPHASTKKVLCFNMLKYKKCNYGTKCMYAHSLNEQKVEALRHKVYSIIRYTHDLSGINLVDDEKLFKTIQQLTRVCPQCVKNICPGGMNCRHGAINTKTRVCYNDLMRGDCCVPDCTSVHLTHRGLVPYNAQKARKKSEPEPDSAVDSDNASPTNIQTFFGRPIRHTSKENITGVLLTDNYVRENFSHHNEDTESDDEHNVDQIIRYLNDASDSEDESIFGDMIQVSCES